MNSVRKKTEKISAFIAVLIMAALALGLLWLAESNVERMLFCSGIILMLIFVRVSKLYCFSYILAVSMLFTMYYTGRNVIPVLRYGNSNQDGLTANSVWSEPQNEFCDPYSADAIMYTIFFRKKCVVNPEGYYCNYAKAIFKDVVTDESVSLMLNHENYIGDTRFENIGVSLARNHILLFADADMVFNNDAYVYVNYVNLKECDRAVLVNDNMGNIYIMAESEWNE